MSPITFKAYCEVTPYQSLIEYVRPKFPSGRVFVTTKHKEGEEIVFTAGIVEEFLPSDECLVTFAHNSVTTIVKNSSIVGLVTVVDGRYCAKKSVAYLIRKIIENIDYYFDAPVKRMDDVKLSSCPDALRSTSEEPQLICEPTLTCNPGIRSSTDVSETPLLDGALVKPNHIGSPGMQSSTDVSETPLLNGELDNLDDVKSLKSESSSIQGSCRSASSNGGGLSRMQARRLKQLESVVDRKPKVQLKDHCLEELGDLSSPPLVGVNNAPVSVVERLEWPPTKVLCESLLELQDLTKTDDEVFGVIWELIPDLCEKNQILVEDVKRLIAKAPNAKIKELLRSVVST